MWTIKRFPGFWLLPALLPVILMTVYPIGHALWTSLHEVMILFPGEPFVGLKNYRARRHAATTSASRSATR